MRTLNIDDLKTCLAENYDIPEIMFLGSGVFADVPYYDFIARHGNRVFKYTVNDYGEQSDEFEVIRREMIVDHSKFARCDKSGVRSEGVRYE